MLHWLAQRAPLTGNSADPGWMIRDPRVRCLLPALYVLEQSGRVQLSEEARTAVKKHYLRNKSCWMMSEYHLRPLLEMLDEADIDVIPLKGGILHSSLYRDSGLRSLSDIDLLVPAEQFTRSAKLLVQAGLALIRPADVGLAQLERVPSADWPDELSFQHSKGLEIDLHRHLMPVRWFSNLYSVNMDAVWQRSIRLSEAEQGSPSMGAGLWKRLLSPYDMLAHLCLHAALHGLQTLKNFMDVDLWIRNLPSAWEWDRFLAIAKEWRIRSAAFHVLMVCRSFMATPVPGEVLRQIDPGGPARWRVGWLVTPETLMTGRPSVGTRYPTLVKVALADRLAGICAALFRAAFPERSRYTHHAARGGILGHWLHVFDVIKRGD